MSKRIVTQRADGVNQHAKRLQKIVSVYVFLMLIIFPLFVTHFYFNILKSKYLYFCVVSIGSAVIMMGNCLYKGIKFLPPRPYVKTIWGAFSFQDKALVIFYVSLIISTICSEFKSQSFWGNEGRLTGLFYYTVVLLAYFIVTRVYHFNGKLLDAALVIGAACSLFGITDYFMMDLLHFKVNLSNTQKSIYVSTFGNINTYTVYVGIVLAIAIVLFATAKCWKKAVFYYICSIVFMFALIMGQSDNAYLSVAAIFGFSPLYLFRENRGIRRYGIIMASFFTVIQCVDWINQHFSDHVYGLTGVFNVITNLNALPYIVVGLWIFTAVLVIVCRKNDNASRVWRYVWGGILILCAGAFIYAFYDANFAGGAEKYGALGDYLKFQDSWGTNRGFVWRISMEMFSEFSVFQKLFGYGPETFGILTSMNYYNEMVKRFRQIYDSAHNEYIQFLLTIGISGLVTYLTFMFSAVWRMIRRGIDKPHVMAVVFAVLAYMVQAIVNINVPVVAPYLLVLLMIALSECREEC